MKTIIEMAREARLPEAWISETGVLKWSELEAFAALVAAAEREVCAKVVEHEWSNAAERDFAEQCAAIIRGREVRGQE